MKYLLTFLLLCLIISCDLNENTSPNPQPSLQLLQVYDLEISEPSGLTFDEFNNCLWTVSDDTNQIYQIDRAGNTLQTLPFVGSDLEGIAYDSSTNSLWVVEEEDRNLVNINLTGDEIQSVEHIIPGSDNSGLEGVCINSENNFFVIKEKNPTLFIKLDDSFSVIQNLKLDFAGDLSGICSTSTNSFWLVSDQEKSLYEITPAGNILQQYELNIPKAEGVVYLENNQEFYIVSDSENRLYHYLLVNN